MLAVHDVSAARNAADELFKIAETLGAPFLRAAAAHAQGAVSLAEGDPVGALNPLRRAVSIWRQLEAPYEAARVRVLVGLACRAVADSDSAEIELDAACHAFQHLGAVPDVERVRSLIGSREPISTKRLTARELQVLSLVATGRTNREISSTLGDQ